KRVKQRKSLPAAHGAQDLAHCAQNWSLMRRESMNEVNFLPPAHGAQEMAHEAPDGPTRCRHVRESEICA
ncbi:hypothetical protein A2U01_0016468, partial [Trifolium medium]|nr:hypothetical protein [Trifolium medium]